MSHLSLGFVALTAIVGATGCVDNGTSIFVQHAAAPDVEDECVVSNDPTARHFGAGVIDTRYQYTYQASLLVGNQLVQRGDSDTLRLETARVQFFEVETEVFDFDGNSLSSFTSPANGFADVGGGDLPGYGIVFAPLVDPCAAGTVVERFGIAQVISRVIVRGETLGGVEVESAPWDFPVTVGVGTLPCFISAEEDIEPFCAAGQDQRVDCRLEADLGDAFPAPDPTSALCRP